VQKKTSLEQGREIEERFQQYQQAMLHYDSSLQANAQASAVVCRLQDTDDTAASSDWDAGILHGSSPPGELMSKCMRDAAFPRWPCACQKDEINTWTVIPA
jgi:hypothetical protein